MVAGALQELGTAQGPGGHHPHGAPVLGPWWGHRLGDSPQENKQASSDSDRTPGTWKDDAGGD